ncbi:hypothetical protein SCA6_002914 [Theobroma cacao]
MSALNKAFLVCSWQLQLGLPCYRRLTPVGVSAFNFYIGDKPLPDWHATRCIFNDGTMCEADMPKKANSNGAR